MYDLHCHLLPNLDDGAQSDQEALHMAQVAVAAGTKEIVCTPHCSTDDLMLPLRLHRIIVQTARMNALLARMKLPLQLHPGMELLCVDSPEEILAEGDFLTLAFSRYLLIEFPFDIRSAAILDAAEAVYQAGLCPVLAHPERYFCVQWTPELISSWVERGWLIQINRGSITGGFGPEARTTARWILRRRLAHLVASDAHSPKARTPDLSRGYQWVERHCSEDYAEQLFRINPKRMLGDHPIAPLGQ